MFEQILVPLDGSPLAECVLPHAVAVARAFQSCLLLLRAVDYPEADAGPVHTVDPLHWQVRKAEAKAYLDAIAVRLQETGLVVEEHLMEGQPAERIVQFARDRDVDLIILSSHGLSGLSRWNVSSVAQKVIFQAYRPVMNVRAYHVASGDVAEPSYERILVPVDGSLRAEHVLPYALHLARFHDAHLMLAHVIKKLKVLNPSSLLDEEVEMVERIEAHNKIEADKYLKNLIVRLGYEAEPWLLDEEDTASALHDLIDRENVDLVVLNAHGYTQGIYWPYSSLALSFIAYGAKPLLIVQDLSPEEMEQTQAEMAARESGGH
jgi:nucleotide-binding universal stress UspA family protein